MAMVVAMAALVGAGVCVAIRLQSGLDAAAGPARDPARGRRCTLADDRRIACRGRRLHAARCVRLPGTQRSPARYGRLILRSCTHCASAIRTRRPPAPDGRVARTPSGSR
jgi:hypothetical protein